MYLFIYSCVYLFNVSANTNSHAAKLLSLLVWRSWQSWKGSFHLHVHSIGSFHLTFRHTYPAKYNKYIIMCVWYTHVYTCI